MMEILVWPDSQFGRFGNKELPCCIFGCCSITYINILVMRKHPCLDLYCQYLFKTECFNNSDSYEHFILKGSSCSINADYHENANLDI